jgi:hypothetical protein
MIVGWVIVAAAVLETVVYGDYYWYQAGIGILMALVGVAMVDVLTEGLPHR